MKALLRTLCAPILRPFESAAGDYEYRPSHRKILIALGLLFLLLSGGCFYASFAASSAAGLLPATVFFVVGAVCEIVGFLGSDRAVARIWKSR
ncbi:MAG: hypothetical protein EP334_02495 [Gammaproteobacteria bacterium]|nr:MAG: hypothetical protein EP334_02495 [Gammaproteobacteria bacterium]